MITSNFERIFLHFYDIHFLQEKGASYQERIYWECRVATRIAIIAANQVFVPAASFVESKMCRDVILELGELLRFGIIELVGGSYKFELFCGERLEIYKPGSYQYDSYSQIKSQDIVVPYKPRSRSTTSDVITHWMQKGSDNTTFTALSKEAGKTDLYLPKNIEDLWHKVPEKLDNLAFILEHVKPLLGDFATNVVVENRLLSLINSGYFKSYTEDLQAGIIVDLVYLDAGHIIPSFGNNLPYKSLIRCLHKEGILDDIKKSDGLQLLKFREDERWLKALNASINVSSDTELHRKKYYLRGNFEMEKKIFIVHGSDHRLLYPLKDYLQNTLKLPEPVILMQQRDGGLTIIEKFESCAAEVYGAIVLMTADDIVKAGTAEEQKRARQNVIFELGFFVGKFGRKSGKVIMLNAGDLEMPSDLKGVIYIDVSDGIEKAGEKIRREIGV